MRDALPVTEKASRIQPHGGMIKSAGEAEAGSAGEQPPRNTRPQTHRNDERGVGVRGKPGGKPGGNRDSLRFCQMQGQYPH